MAIQQILESVSAASLKTDVPDLRVGDTVNVHVRIVEGDKERVQIFQGVLIRRKGRGINEMIVVRRVVDEVGIERTFPMNSPMIAKFEVVRSGDARRAKLYYLRERVGKSRRLRDRRRGLGREEGAEGTETSGGSAAETRPETKREPKPSKKAAAGAAAKA